VSVARRISRVFGFVLWLAVVLALAEGAVRLAGFVLRRDQALPPARAGAHTIYCIGDSFTYGQGVERSDAWPQVLARMLDADGERDVRVQTLAEPGRSSSVAMLEAAKALKAGDARLVLVMTGWNANDGDFAAWSAAHARAVPWTARADLLLSHSRLYRVLKHAATYRSRTLVLDDVEVIPQTTGMQLYDFRAYQEIARDNLTRIAAMCHAAAVPCAFLTYPHQDLPANPYTKTEYYHALFGRTPIAETDYLIRDRRPGEIAIDAVIRTVAATSDVPLIDTQPAFLAGGDGLYQADWHHPTAKGHRLLAEAVHAALRERGLVGGAAARRPPR
jgi:lysophospholipase L1-like esterase